MVTFTEEILNGKLQFLYSDKFENGRRISSFVSSLSEQNLREVIIPPEIIESAGFLMISEREEVNSYRFA